MKIWKSVCEKVFYKGLIVSLIFLDVTYCLSLFYLFQREKKNVFESTDGPYPQLTVHCTEVGKGMSPAGLVNRARGEEQVEGKEQVGGSRAGRGSIAGKGGRAGREE